MRFRRFQRRLLSPAWPTVLPILKCLGAFLLLHPMPCHAETDFIPSVTGSQSYDSNVWGGPSSFVPAGKKQYDYVSSLSTQLQYLVKNRQMDTALQAGASGNVYVHNRELDYVSFNAGLFSNLDGWINQFLEGAKLKVANSFVYTPQPPSFLTGGQAPQTADVLLRGIQGARANTFLNNGSVSTSYGLAPGVGLQGRYDVGLIRFGQIFARPTQPTAIPVVYFNTTYHNFSIGPTFSLSPEDAVSVNYEPTLNYLSGSGVDQSFSTQSFAAQYVRATPHWTTTLRAGATTIDVGQNVFFSGAVSVTGNFATTTRIRTTLSRRVTPAFYAGGGATLTDAAGLYIDHKFTRLLTLSINGSHGRGTTVPVNFLKYSSYQGIALLRYQLTRLIDTSLSYEYDHYKYESPAAGGVPASGFSFSRHFFTLSLNATWK